MVLGGVDGAARPQPDAAAAAPTVLLVSLASQVLGSRSLQWSSALVVVALQRLMLCAAARLRLCPGAVGCECSWVVVAATEVHYRVAGWSFPLVLRAAPGRRSADVGHGG